MKQYARLAVPVLIAAACTGGDQRSPTAPDVGPASAPLAPLAARPVASPSITVTALPSLGGAARANGINDGGTIVGWSTDAAGVTDAVKWTFQSGAWTIAQLPDGPSGSAAAINATGDIVGMRGGDVHRAVLWPAGGGSVVLGCPENLGPDAALAINAQRTIAGYRSDGGVSPLPSVAVVWPTGACRQDLPALAFGKSAVARGIDDAGNVSGHAYDAEGDEWAVRWTFQNGVWNIQPLDDGEHAAAWGMNDIGDIAGSGCPGTTTPPCRSHAMFWPAGGGKTDLGTLGGQVSAAFALNSAQELVGWTNTFPKPSTRGFIWSLATGMRGLSPLKRDNRSEAYGVNNAQADGSRQVVGLSARSGTQQAVVWRVP